MSKRKELNLEINAISEILKECQGVSDVNKMDVLLMFLKNLYKKDKTSKILIFTVFLFLFAVISDSE